MVAFGSFVDGQVLGARCGQPHFVFDMVGPLFIDTSGWRLVAGHFAERHGLIVIVALGESIVAIGVGPRRESTVESSSLRSWAWRSPVRSGGRTSTSPR